MTEKFLKIIAWNVQGYGTSKDAVTTLLNTEKPDILFISETKMAPTSSFAPKLRTLAISRCHHNTGIAMFIADHVKFSPGPVHISNASMQVVSIRAGDITIFGVYISPTANRDFVKASLEKIESSTTGRKIIIGDLNARKRKWDKTDNAIGNLLHRWSTSAAWRIHAPTQPTFYCSTGSSTVDLLVTKRCTGARVQRIQGDWDGASDHLAIQALVPSKAPPRERSNRISRARRRRQDLHDASSTLFETAMPLHTESFKKVQTSEELTAACNSLTQKLLQMFISRGKPRQCDSSPAWTQELDAMSKIRSRLYHRMIRTTHPADRRRYKKINHRIKRKYRREKRRCFKDFSRELDEGNSSSVAKRMSAIIKAKKRNRTKFGARQEPEIQLERFTTFVANKFPPQSPAVKPLHFIVTQEMENFIAMAALQTPSDKAAGEDNLFGELFRIAPEHTTPTLIELWKACGRVADIPESWKKFNLVALHKKDSKSDPKNYRPIALISHLRKIFEKALDWKVKSITTFHHFQCGFRSHRSIEQAILRFSAAKRMGHKYTAVLDLRGAYPSVPRSKLFAVIQQRVTPNTAAAISMFLGTDLISTCGDESGKVEQVRVGVPEGSPLSPTIFNLYIDVLTNKLAQTKQKFANLPATIYADDVVLFAKTSRGLRKLLRVCTDWARSAGMKWNTDPGKSCILAPPECFRTFTLAGQPIEKVDETNYLGVIVDFTGVLHANTSSRSRAAFATMRLIANAGVLSNVYLPRRIYIYNTFLRPKFDFGIHLAPWRDEYSDDALAVERAILKHPSHTLNLRTWARYHNIIGMDNIKTRRNKLGADLISRLQRHIDDKVYQTPAEKWLAHLELESAKDLFTEEQVNDPKKEQREYAEIIEHKVRERRGCPSDNSPIMELPGPFIRMATLWYFSKFPMYERRLQIPNYNQRKMRIRPIMRKASWTNEEKRTVIEEFSVYAQYTNYHYDYTEQ